LIENGANINYVNNFRNEEYDIVKLLIENGANVNQNFGEKKGSLLMYAITYDNNNYYIECRNKIIKLLIDSNAEIDYKDMDGNTALTYALQSNNNEIVNYLIVCGADL
ncbi:ankyrin, partial [Piromyces finnis]